MEKKFALTEPTGSYFVNPSYQSWDFTKDVKKATTFETLKEATEMKEILERAVYSTYWDYDDIIPQPSIVEV